MTGLLEVVLTDVADAAADGMTAAGVTPPDGPWTTHTKPVIDFSGDCDRRLAVFYEKVLVRGFGTGRPASPGDLQQPGIHGVLQVRVQVWDCVANLRDSGVPPTLAEQAADANRLAKAAWGILVELSARRKASTLFPTLDRSPGDVGLDQAVPLTPDGYMAGWQINLEVGVPFVLDVTPLGS